MNELRQLVVVDIERESEREKEERTMSSVVQTHIFTLLILNVLSIKK
jgi:hypothetical protein